MVSKEKWIALEEALNRHYQMAQVEASKKKNVQTGGDKDGGINSDSRSVGYIDH